MDSVSILCLLGFSNFSDSLCTFLFQKQGWGIGAMLLFKIALIQLCITLRHAQIGMRHQMLQAEHISAVFQKERCKAVSELIGRDLFPALFAVFQKCLIQMVYLDFQNFSRNKKEKSKQST